MIKKGLLLILFSSLFLTACSENKTMIFVGESENWQVNYEVNVIDSDSEATNLTIKYLGEEPIPEEIKYLVESVTGKSEGEDSLDKGVLKAGGHTCDGCAVIQENEEINATITWNGESENIKLKKKEQ